MRLLCLLLVFKAIESSTSFNGKCFLFVPRLPFSQLATA